MQLNCHLPLAHPQRGREETRWNKTVRRRECRHHRALVALSFIACERSLKVQSTESAVSAECSCLERADWAEMTVSGRDGGLSRPFPHRSS